jgi:hypothetical protein
MSIELSIESFMSCWAQAIGYSLWQGDASLRGTRHSNPFASSSIYLLVPASTLSIRKLDNYQRRKLWLTTYLFLYLYFVRSWGDQEHNPIFNSTEQVRSIVPLHLPLAYTILHPSLLYWATDRRRTTISLPYANKQAAWRARSQRAELKRSPCPPISTAKRSRAPHMLGPERSTLDQAPSRRSRTPMAEIWLA